MKHNLIVLLGPTATGKTKLGSKLAYSFNGEIISADSRQVYKMMDIGTGKDLADYCVGDVKISYHLIDVVEPFDEFDLYKFNTLFYNLFNKITLNNKTPFLIGGTSLYLYSIIKGYNLIPVNFESDEYKTLNGLSEEELKKKIASVGYRFTQHNRFNK
ncbi:MAG: isopentenyl transferase family protein [bacterium]